MLFLMCMPTGGHFSDRYLVGLIDGRLDAVVTGPIARCRYVTNCAQSMH